MEDMEMIVMNIIVGSGSSRSYAMEAIAKAKNFDFSGADESLRMCDESLLEAHHIQTDLIQKEAGGEKTEMSLLMVHAQDHLMTSIVVKDLAKEFVDLYKKMDELKK